MGRFDSLTSLALGRTPYEPTAVIHVSSLDPSPPPDSSLVPPSQYIQRYTSHGRPTNPVTRHRERQSIRAANKVLQVTGVVENLWAVKEKERQSAIAQIMETVRGIRLVELGIVLLTHVGWGVKAFRRRILVMVSLSHDHRTLTNC